MFIHQHSTNIRFVGRSRYSRIAVPALCFIKIDNLCKKFGYKKVIDELCLDLGSAEITALVGKNGTGKSTLIRLIAGVLKPDSGIIEFEEGEQIDVLLGGNESSPNLCVNCS